MKMKTKLILEIGGYIGMICVQGAFLPVLFSIIFYDKENTMPLYYILLIGGGLFLYLLRSIIRKDILYIISNSIGFTGQVLLATITILN